MAENETLDLHRSSRWRRPLEALRDHLSEGEVADLIRLSLSGSWEKVRREFVKAGYSLEQIIDAAIEGNDAYLDQAYRDLRYHRFVKLLRESVRFMDSRDQVMERAVRQQLLMAKQQIRDELAQDPRFKSVAEAAAVTGAAFDQVRDAAADFARLFVDSPRNAKQRLRKSTSTDAQTKAATQAAIMNLSILPTRQAVGRAAS
jgi:hypothetical protein